MDARKQLNGLARDIAGMSGERDNSVRIVVLYVDRSNPTMPPKVGQVFTCTAPAGWECK